MVTAYSDNASYVLAESKDINNTPVIPSGGGQSGVLTADYTVTVGASGNYKTLNAALEALSAFYPTYKKGGLKCEVKILSGTVINEQISVKGIDLSYITITSVDAYVNVNVDGFTSQGLDTHDLRTPNVGAFIGGENGAGLPTIGTLFKVSKNTNDKAVVGYFANRSSKGIVLADCGFEGFNDGVISNNESSITIREGIARNNKRWGVHARHNGEVSARSCDCSGNGTYGAYADRVADLDVREALINNCTTAINGEHCSRICASGAHSTGCKYVGKASTAAVVDCSSMEIINPTGTIFTVSYGGIINCYTTTITNGNGVGETSLAKNTLGSHGIIWG